MNESGLDLNIAFLVFNRPEATRVVFEEIRRAKPKRLFVIADGPRNDRPEEVERCRQVRDIVDRGIDWDCEVFKNYSETNLGCRGRPSSGLDWVFKQVEYCIILEDDCLPHPSFFPFCQELLARYQNDERVMMISGDNFLSGELRTNYSYYYSDIAHIWGWATWRRAWQKYDIDLGLWSEIKAGSWLGDIFWAQEQVGAWTQSFDRSVNGFNTWDYQWAFCCLVHRGLCVMPSVNLISNIGFDQNATHTITPGGASNLPASEMKFPLNHPPFMIRDRGADLKTFFSFNPPVRQKSNMTVWQRIFSKVKSYFD